MRLLRLRGDFRNDLLRGIDTSSWDLGQSLDHIVMMKE
jgi:hypothetical protein